MNRLRASGQGIAGYFAENFGALGRMGKLRYSGYGARFLLRDALYESIEIWVIAIGRAP